MADTVRIEVSNELEESHELLHKPNTDIPDSHTKHNKNHTKSKDSKQRRKLSQEHKRFDAKLSFMGQVLLWTLKCVVAVYGSVTLPIYFVLQQPWKVWKAKKRVWSRQVDPADPYSPWVGVTPQTDLFEGVSTMNELFRWCVDRYRYKRFCGQRTILAECDYYTAQNKMIKKYNLGEYKWYTWADMEQRVENLCNGLLEIGLKPKSPVLILAETRMEWMVILHACFRLNIPVATLFPNLGDEGIIHGINEAEVKCIFTSQEALSKLQKISNRLPFVSHIVYMESLRPVDKRSFPANISILQLSEVENTTEAGIRPEPPSPDDLAVLMFTSGSTGTPKGVMLSHRNLVSLAANCVDIVQPALPGDIYLAYLPIAHAFEMCSEIYFSSLGVIIGYSSPFTMTDKSTGIMEGGKGDATILKPDIMNVVPLILDRVRKSVYDAVDKKSKFAQEFFNYALEYKIFWYRKGFGTPILNTLVFKKIKALLGGKVRLMVGGGAPLSPDTHDFIRMILDAPILQGYGMTETTSGIIIMTNQDRSTGKVGGPFGTGLVRLVDWPDGNYYVTDEPYPRGEVVIGGDTVSMGYFKQEQLTKDTFVDMDGVRWVYSGDIGEMYPNGSMKIIDRKKDLVKLQCGEYISLGKVEAELKTCPLVDNICVVGNSFYDYLVALVSPSVEQIKILGQKLNKAHLTFTDLCNDSEVISFVTKIIKELGQKSQLHKYEIPRKIKLCTEEWQPENGTVTAAFKIRRKFIEEFYRDAIEELYELC